MKQANTLVTGMTAIALLSVAACSHKVATVNKPPDITPVATASSQPARTAAAAKETVPPPAAETGCRQSDEADHHAG